MDAFGRLLRHELFMALCRYIGMFVVVGALSLIGMAIIGGIFAVFGGGE